MRLGRVAVSVLLVGVIALGLWLPLHDVLSYRDRTSVLPNLQVDAAAYDAFARDLATRWDLEALPTKHPPGWITLLAVVYRVAGASYVTGKLISWIALIASVALCAWLARRIYGSRAAWVAAALCASSPALRGYVGTLQYEVTTGALMLALLALALRARDATSSTQLATRAALAGVVGAALVLTRETFVIVVPLVAGWVAHHSIARAGRARAIAGALLLVAVAATPAIAWSTVQSLRAGYAVTISEKGTMVVELGNNPLANGTYNAPAVGVGEPTGGAFVRQFPQRAFVLAVRKVLYSWGVLRDGWNVPRPVAVWIWRATTGLVPLQAIEVVVRGGWLLATFAIALWLLGRDGWRAWWIYPATVVAILMVHVVTLASYRFLVPILPVVYVVVSGPLARAAEAVVRSLRAPAVAAACGVVLAIATGMQFQRWPLHVFFKAVDLDGLDVANVADSVTGKAARFADAKRGVRPIVLLADEYLPRGALSVIVRVRQEGSDSPLVVAPVARVALVQMDGHIACSRDVSGAQLPPRVFTDLVVPCLLTKDGPATLMVLSLGVVDLSIGEVQLGWNR